MGKFLLKMFKKNAFYEKMVFLKTLTGKGFQPLYFLLFFSWQCILSLHFLNNIYKT
jgi:hypothetical protein